MSKDGLLTGCSGRDIIFKKTAKQRKSDVLSPGLNLKVDILSFELGDIGHCEDYW